MNTKQKTRLPRCLYNGKSPEAWREQFRKDALHVVEKSKEPTEEFTKKSGLHISYQAFLQFFRERKATLDLNDFIVATQFTYGWMPTINDMYGDPREAFDAFNQLTRAGLDIQQDEAQTLYLFQKLIPATNNSLVGASKLLHFACPERFAIWDSQVFRYFYAGKNMTSNQLTQLDRYLQYHSVLADLSEDQNMKQILESLQFHLTRALPKAFQQEVVLTNYRCLEFVMYSTAIANTKAAKIAANVD